MDKNGTATDHVQTSANGPFQISSSHTIQDAPQFQQSAFKKIIQNPQISMTSIDPDCMIVPSPATDTRHCDQEVYVISPLVYIQAEVEELEKDAIKTQETLLEMKCRVDSMVQCLTRIEDKTKLVTSMDKNVQELYSQSATALNEISCWQKLRSDHSNLIRRKKVFPIRSLEEFYEVEAKLVNESFYYSVLSQVKDLPVYSDSQVFKYVFDDLFLVTIQLVDNKLFNIIADVCFNNDVKDMQRAFVEEYVRARKRVYSKNRSKT